MTVEENACIRPEVAHQRYTSGKLIDKESRRLELPQLTAKGDRNQEMILAEDGKENLEATEKSCGEESVTTDADVEGACSFNGQLHVRYEMSKSSSG